MEEWPCSSVAVLPPPANQDESSTVPAGVVKYSNKYTYPQYPVVFNLQQKSDILCPELLSSIQKKTLAPLRPNMLIFTH
jgi:hypothetical protein